MTDWQSVFSQSKVNGCEYVEPEWNQRIEFPRGTWLQERLALVREKEGKDEDV